MRKRPNAKDVFNQSPLAPMSRRDILNRKLSVQVAPLSEQKNKVTPMQWKFVQELVSGDGKVTTVQAALNAGYSEKFAREKAYELTNAKKNPHVVAAIQQYRRDLAERYGTTFERHMKDLQIIRDKALEAGNYSAAVQAEYRRGQAIGTIYVERKEIRHGTIDSMSVEEVRKKLEEIRMMYGTDQQSNVIDVNPEPDDVIEQEPETDVDDYDEESEDIDQSDEEDHESEDDPDAEDDPESEDDPEPENKNAEGLKIIEEMRERQRLAAAEERAKRMRIKNCPKS
jgi:phage terminase small subunit